MISEAHTGNYVQCSETAFQVAWPCLDHTVQTQHFPCLCSYGVPTAFYHPLLLSNVTEIRVFNEEGKEKTTNRWRNKELMKQTFILAFTTATKNKLNEYKINKRFNDTVSIETKNYLNNLILFSK